MLKILLCDVNKKFIEACDRENKTHEGKINWCQIETLVCDITKLKLDHAAYLSPANGFGTMGGGIDHVFATKMFPGIHKIVMEKISKLDTKTKQIQCFETYDGEIEEFEDIVPYLPVGNVIVTDLSIYPNFASCYLITSPTMVEPSNVAHTQNAYLSMRAALSALRGSALSEMKDIKTLVVCGLCTGVGGMSEKESARQIFKAILEIKK